MSREVEPINSIPMPNSNIRAIVEWLIDGNNVRVLPPR